MSNQSSNQNFSRSIVLWWLFVLIAIAIFAAMGMTYGGWV